MEEIKAKMEGETGGSGRGFMEARIEKITAKRGNKILTSLKCPMLVEETTIWSKSGWMVNF